MNDDENDTDSNIVEQLAVKIWEVILNEEGLLDDEDFDDRLLWHNVTSNRDPAVQELVHHINTAARSSLDLVISLAEQAAVDTRIRTALATLRPRSDRH
jgi:hypothetical protein